MRSIHDVLIPQEVKVPSLYFRLKRDREERNLTTVFERLCRACEALRFLALGPKQEVAKVLELARLEVKPEGVLASATIAALLSLSLGSLAFLWLGSVVPLVIALTLAVVAYWSVVEFPIKLARAEQRKVASRLPEVLSQLLVLLRQNPNLEASISSVIECQEGRVREELEKLVTSVLRGEHSNISQALEDFAERWKGVCPALKDVVYGIKASEMERDRAARIASLERTMDGFLATLLRSFGSFVSAIVTPVTILVSFCILLPLVLLAALVPFMGLGQNVILVLFLVLIATHFYSSYIVQRIPPFIPELSIEFPRHRAVNFFGKQVPLVAFSLLAGGLVALPGALHLLGYKGLITDALGVKPLLLGLAVGVGSYLWFSASPKREEAKVVEEVEEEVLDAFYRLGSRLESRLSPEEAMRQVAESMKGSQISKLFQATLKNVRERGMSLSSAFLDPKYGSLARFPSEKLRSLTRLFLSSLRQGCEVAAHVLVNLVNYQGRVEKAREEMRRQLSRPLFTALIAGVFVAPAVCGVAVCFQETIKEMREGTKEWLRTTLWEAEEELPLQSLAEGPLGLFPEVEVAHLELLLGLYVFALCLLLLRFVSSLRGDNPVRSRLSLAKGCVAATLIYVAVVTLLKPVLLFNLG